MGASDDPIGALAQRARVCRRAAAGAASLHAWRAAAATSPARQGERQAVKVDVRRPDQGLVDVIVAELKGWPYWWLARLGCADASCGAPYVRMCDPCRLPHSVKS